MNINNQYSVKPSGVPWLGDIPAGWKMERLGVLYTHRNEKVSDKDFPPLSVTMKGVVPQLATAAKTDDGDNRKLVRKGDFAINSRSDRRGSCGISAYDGSVSLINTILTPRGQMSPAYFDWLFHTEAFADEFYKWGHGIVDDLWTTRWSEMKRIQIVRPPLPEQRAIADYLDEKCGAIDAAIAEAKKGIEEYKAWKKSLIFEAVTGKWRVGAFNAETRCARDEVVGLPERSEPEGPQGAASRREAEKMKPSGIPWIGEIPEGWRVMRLKHLIGILPGYAFKSEDFNFSNGIRLLRGINVGVDSLRWDECVYWDKVISEDLDRYQIQAGDLIVGLDRPWIEEGTRVCFAKKEDLPCLLVQRVCRIRTLGEMDLRIINYWLSSEAFERALACDTTGVSVPHISPYQIMEFRITLPSLPEQQAIADYLDDKCAAIDAMVAEKEALIADLEAYKKSLIYETVTGKREVA